MAALFHTDCPSCGAPVRSMSASAVTLVCSYCHSLLIRDGDTLTDSGEDSALLEDFSPLQIGTGGVYHQQPFTLVGRLQARYDAGVWNEWYLLFADGSDGWLSESGDQYVLTRPVAPEPPPAFASLRAGSSRYNFRNKAFLAAASAAPDKTASPTSATAANFSPLITPTNRRKCSTAKAWRSPTSNCKTPAATHKYLKQQAN